MASTTTMLACTACWNPIGPRARAVHLSELSFHEVWAPRCRACGDALTESDERHWTFDGKVVWNRDGYSVQPTELWCERCCDLHDRDVAFAQD